MAQQTAVEWLQELYNSRPTYEEFIMEDEFDQAKVMEKQQITYAYNNGVDDAYADEYKEMDDYYDKIYNK